MNLTFFFLCFFHPVFRPWMEQLQFKTPADELNVIGRLKGQHPMYSVEGLATGTGNTTLAKTVLDLSLQKPYYEFSGLYGQGIKCFTKSPFNSNKMYVN